MTEKLSEEIMALRAAREFKDGDVINLGAGIPNLCAMFIPEDRNILFESENGALGYGGIIMEDEFEKVEIQHIDAGGRYFLPKEGTYPLTGKECVSLIVTDIAVIEPTKEGLVLKEFAPGWTVEEIQKLTEPKLIPAEDLKEIEL